MQHIKAFNSCCLFKLKFDNLKSHILGLTFFLEIQMRIYLVTKSSMNSNAKIFGMKKGANTKINIFRWTKKAKKEKKY